MKKFTSDKPKRVKPMTHGLLYVLLGKYLSLIPKKCGYILVITMLLTGYIPVTTAGEVKTAFIQQQITVTGVVTDENGETLPGATILVKGSTRGVTTDVDGSYSINVEPDGILEITFIGYEMMEIPVLERRRIDITLVPKANELDEVTVVAFAKQKKESVIASVTTVNPSELRVPSSNLTTAFAGRLAGLISYQRTGEPGQDNAEFFIRGITTFGTGKKDPLILIDGVEMTTEELSRLTTDDIASFSIMKDANATALYGARGANGVILVNTKEGREGKAKVQFRIEGSFSQPTLNIGLVDPVNYMKYHNEAVVTRNPGRNLPYSQKKIAYTERGIDPDRYPANDWQDMLFDKNTFNHRYNLNVSGGGTVARYYVAASYAKDQGIIKNDPRNSFSNNIDITKYSLRSNVNVNLTKFTELIVRLSGSFDDYTGPLDGGTDLYIKAINSNPVYFKPYYEPDEANLFTKHVLYGNYSSGNYMNPYAEMTKGFRTEDRSNMYAQFELKQDFDFIIKGLSMRGLFNVTRYSKLPIRRMIVPFFYSLAEESVMDTYYLNPLNPDEGRDYLTFEPSNRELESTMYFEGAVNYNRTFEKHTVSGLMVYTVREMLNGTTNDYTISLPHRNLGLAGRITYSYDSRYFVEGNFGYNGSERFHASKRWGFFPSAGLGWIVSNEKFMKPVNGIVSKLKLKATYGMVGNDAIGSDNERFFYMSNLNMNDSGRRYSFGDDYAFSTPDGISISQYADPNITWEISKKSNFGLELNLLNSLEIQVDYFTENRSNILQSRSSIPTTMGLQATPRANIGKASSKGVEFSVDYNKSFTPDFWTLIRGNFTYASGKYEVYEEPDYVKAPWRSRVGSKLSQTYGYVAERLFIDERDVANSPNQEVAGGIYGAGDIKYKDINGNMRIEEDDQVAIGYPTTPEIIYGFGLSAGYKGLDISCFFQGSARSSFWINPTSTAPFVGDGRAMMQYYADSYWSEDNRNIYALWPRLSEDLVPNNNVTSTWFMRNGSFLRLKTTEIGYSLPSLMTRKIYLQHVRFYLSGSNLCVFSRFKMWDPEMAGNGLAYPLQRVYNIGVNIEF